jgi:hypothetical protein
MPEPQLTVREKLIPISARTAERIEAALGSDRLVLLKELVNVGQVPQLAVPRGIMKMEAVPLVEGGKMYRPTDPDAKVSGYAIDGTGPRFKDPVGGNMPAFTDAIFSDPPDGFIPIPAPGRAWRSGAPTEVLPIS